MIHRILHLGEEALRRDSEPITAIDDKLRVLVVDMFETMHKARGVGLAAPQIGINKRLMIIDVDEHPLVFINPEIIRKSGKETCEEGCLSLPGLRENVSRATKVLANAIDLDGKSFEIEAEGLLARAIQHEIDHLDGVLFIDRISKARRIQIKRDLERLEAGETLESPDAEDDPDEAASDNEANTSGQHTGASTPALI
ncbi:MAG: peptide deformylase [Candidatus Riflebacteria bacterium]|nr:peptide deformylase [Candidatus Riflebacteria bacterium]